MNVGSNRLGGCNQTQVLEFVMQQYKIYIVKNQNLLRTIETNYMYFLTRTIETVGERTFEEVADFFQTVVADDVWSYVLISHMNHVEQPDDQFLEAMMHEINALIS